TIPAVAPKKWCDASVIPNDARFYVIRFLCIIINALLNAPLVLKLLLFVGIVLLIVYKVLKRIEVI
ncbi:MAG: hypothetical protein QW734_07045, partial [Candidatus Bathyarchaeia archaeon]